MIAMTEGEILKKLSTKSFGKNLLLLDSVDSTNERLRMMAENGAPEGTLVIAEEQTSGRGRRGHRWMSQKGKNLTFSVLLRPDMTKTHPGVFPLLAGVAIAESIGEQTGQRADCKWPNDVLIDGKKVCGILCESVIAEGRPVAIVVGIGINVNQREFPTELASSAASLSNGQDLDRTPLLCRVVRQLEEWYERAINGKSNDLLQRWISLSSMMGKNVVVDQDGLQFTGSATGILDDGALVLQKNGSEVAVRSGSIVSVTE